MQTSQTSSGFFWLAYNVLIGFSTEFQQLLSYPAYIIYLIQWQCDAWIVLAPVDWFHSVLHQKAFFSLCSCIWGPLDKYRNDDMKLEKDLTSIHWLSLFFKSRDSPGVWTLYFGKLNQTGPNVNEVARTVSQVIVHPDYNNTLLNNDIALMKLSSPVTFTDYIRPICLASNSSQFHNSTSCWATGWGRLGKDGEYHSQFWFLFKS